MCLPSCQELRGKLTLSGGTLDPTPTPEGLRGPDLTMFQKDSVSCFTDLQHAERPCGRVLHISGKGGHDPASSLGAGGTVGALFLLIPRVCLTHALGVDIRHTAAQAAKL